MKWYEALEILIKDKKYIICAKGIGWMAGHYVKYDSHSCQFRREDGTFFMLSSFNINEEWEILKDRDIKPSEKLRVPLDIHDKGREFNALEKVIASILDNFNERLNNLEKVKC